jgi:polyhydroxyalkanoate synthesis regulator phasin
MIGANDIIKIKSGISLCEEFADKQVVDDLIKEVQRAIITQSNLIDRLKIFEEKIADNFVMIRREINDANKNNDLLERRIDNLDKFIQNLLINKYEIKEGQVGVKK